MEDFVMSLDLYPLPLDITGNAFTNKVVREYHSLKNQVNNEYKVIVLDKGHFYKESLSIKDHTGLELRMGLDYQTTMFNPEIFSKTGLQACAVIVITRNDVIGDIYVTAQMVGDQYCKLGESIVSQSLGILNNTRNLQYKNIKDLPDTFTLNKHMHPYWDLYAFTPRTLKIKRIVDLFDDTIVRSLQEVYNDFDSHYNKVLEEKNKLDSQFRKHMSRLDNPHRTVKAQVGLSEAFNGRIANDFERKSGDRALMNLYLTPLGAQETLTTMFTTRLDDHKQDFDNPHNVTAAQLNTIETLAIEAKDNTYYDRGETVDFTYRFGGVKNSSYTTTTAGKDFNTLFTELRNNLDGREIKSGILKNTNFLATLPAVNSVIVPNASGNLEWRSISSIVKALGGKSSAIYNLAGWRDTNWNSLIAAANAFLNPAHLAEGTVLLANLYDTTKWYWYNGTRHQYIYSVVMMVVQNGAWVL